jgi:hypothetical protein
MVRELFYLDTAGRVMAVPVSLANGTFDRGAASELFKTMLYGDIYTLASDGQRFLVARPAATGEAVALDSVINPFR